MAIIENYEDFLFYNGKKINKIISEIGLTFLIAPPLMLIFSLLNVLVIPLKSIFIFTAVLVPFISIQFILTKKCTNQGFVALFSLIGIEIMVAFLGSDGAIIIDIAYALVPFLSILYFNLKLTRLITLFSYASMILSIYISSKTAYLNVLNNDNPMQYFLGYLCGFSIEFIFVYLITTAITKRCCSTLRGVYSVNQKLSSMQKEIISSFANLVESRDSFTGEHIKRTSKYVELIARELKKQGYYVDELSDDKIELFVSAAPLHDLGKLHVPDYILTKQDKLTFEEFEKIKEHPKEGEKLIDENLTDIEAHEYVSCAKQMSLYHHEKWDGNGYPNKISGLKIPLCARIMAAADVLDALLSKRQYKEAMTLEKAFSIIKDSSGTHFEPCIVEALLACKEQIEEIAFA